MRRRDQLWTSLRIKGLWGRVPWMKLGNRNPWYPGWYGSLTWMSFYTLFSGCGFFTAASVDRTKGSFPRQSPRVFSPTGPWPVPDGDKDTQIMVNSQVHNVGFNMTQPESSSSLPPSVVLRPLVSPSMGSSSSHRGFFPGWQQLSWSWGDKRGLPLLHVSVPGLWLCDPFKTLEVGLSVGGLRSKSLRPGGLESTPHARLVRTEILNTHV
jgi:hypothetical protein